MEKKEKKKKRKGGNFWKKNRIGEKKQERVVGNKDQCNIPNRGKGNREKGGDGELGRKKKKKQHS